MKILILSPYPHEILPSFYGHCDDISVSEEMPGNWDNDLDWIISFGYRHIIGRPTLEEYPNKIINIHTSVLPWNRGSDPNFWSWFDNTPKGVSIHRIEKGLDTGPLYGQMSINFRPKHTLRSSYDVLRKTAALYFSVMWPSIRTGSIKPHKQPRGGSYHKSSDKDEIFSMLAEGWDTPVSEVETLGRRFRGETIANFHRR